MRGDRAVGRCRGGLVFLLLTALFVFSGCRRSEATPKTEFVLFDLSASTATPKVRERYLADFEKILANLHEGDTLVVDRITDNPLAQSTFPVNETVKEMNPWTENPLIWRRQTKKQKDRIETAVKEMVLDNKQKFNKTSILDALHLAQRVFASYPAEEKVLVIFSDMVEESAYYDFRTEELSRDRIGRILDAERQAIRLPRLKDVRVYVVGAVAGYYSRRIEPERVRQIQNFWLEYFRAAGADLPVERYGSGLLLPPQ